jgi:cobalamin biosynthesis protein CobD/CbiB
LKINTTHYYNTLASSVPGIGNGFVKSVNWTEEKSSFFVAILNENLEFYLDEIIDAYFKQTKILLHPSTIWRKLMKQGYRLKIYSERAKQQNEADRAAYMKALHLLVQIILLSSYLSHTLKIPLPTSSYITHILEKTLLSHCVRVREKKSILVQ